MLCNTNLRNKEKNKKIAKKNGHKEQRDEA